MKERLAGALRAVKGNHSRHFPLNLLFHTPGEVQSPDKVYDDESRGHSQYAFSDKEEKEIKRLFGAERLL